MIRINLVRILIFDKTLIYVQFNPLYNTMLMYYVYMNRYCYMLAPVYSLLLIAWLTGCSSHLPENIKNPPAINPKLPVVQTNLTQYLSTNVRWGGVIATVENQKNGSQLEIVAYPLTDNGKPIIDQNSTGRFIAITGEFLEPTIYKSDRLITIAGTILGNQIKNIGAYPYNHIEVRMNNHYLWPADDKIQNEYPPDYWWYDPWYPYHPFYHPYPY